MFKLLFVTNIINFINLHSFFQGYTTRHFGTTLSCHKKVLLSDILRDCIIDSHFYKK